MINYRSLFDELRVEWTDRGANTSAGHINVRCPWCGGADPSHHLSIEEETGGYYCFRSNDQHKGISPWLLLRKLGVAPAVMDALVARHSSAPASPRTRERPTPPPTWWETFPPASASPEALDYLSGRGFEDPAYLAQRCDLRVAEEGRLARRILLPISDGRQIIGYTARAMHAKMNPKYWTHPAVTGGVYVPVEPSPERPLFVTEGPFDTLALWGASGVNAAAILGLALPESRLNRLRPLLRQATITYLVLDSDQDKLTAHTMRAALQRQTAEPYRPVDRIAGPAGHKDLGDTPPGEIREWITNLVGTSRR